MLNRKLKDRIYSLAWDATVGCGNVGEDASNEPGLDHIECLKRVLGKDYTPECDEELLECWLRCLAEAEHP